MVTSQALHGYSYPAKKPHLSIVKQKTDAQKQEDLKVLSDWIRSLNVEQLQQFIRMAKEEYGI